MSMIIWKSFITISSILWLSGICTLAQATFSSTESHPLPPEEAYAFSATQQADGVWRVEFQIRPNYYLYADKLRIIPADGWRTDSVQSLGLPVTKEDPFFGVQQVFYQYAGLAFTVRGAGNDTITIEYQGCWEGGICYPVQQQVIALSPGFGSPNAGATFNFSDARMFTDLLNQSSVLWVLLFFYLAGLLLTFTPCVLPMIPIIAGMVLGAQSQTRGRRMRLAGIFVLIMAGVYALLGAISGWIGINLQNFLQHPLLIVVFSSSMVLFACSMFGFFAWRWPASWQGFADRWLIFGQPGGYARAASLGLVSALLVSPCVSAPLAAGLLFLAHNGDPVLGSMALFLLAIGMGTPLLLVSAGLVTFLPSQGAWMVGVKAAFGVLLLLLAVFMLDRILPDTLVLLLYGAILIVSASVLWRLSALAIWRGIAVLLLIYGGILTLGGSLGNGNPFAPLHSLNTSTKTKLAGNDYFSTSVDRIAALEHELARSGDQPLLLYYTAEWCIACQELKRFTFSDAAVQQRLAQFHIVEVDVTQSTTDSRQLLQRYEVFGPPALIFPHRDGTQRPHFSVMHFVKAKYLADWLDQVLSSEVAPLDTKKT